MTSDGFSSIMDVKTFIGVNPSGNVHFDVLIIDLTGGQSIDDKITTFFDAEEKVPLTHHIFIVCLAFNSTPFFHNKSLKF
jgi:hypothetical protein